MGDPNDRRARRALSNVLDENPYAHGARPIESDSSVHAPPSSALGAHPYRTRRIVGAGLWIAGQAVGGCLFLFLFLVLPLLQENARETFVSMFLGALVAFPAMAVYLTFPRLLDRYDPEPAYVLALALLWGALAACGFAGLINSLVDAFFSKAIDAEAGEAISAVISAPIVEETFKGVMVLGIFYCLRDEFDGVVDGVIYATFTAVGFAATENVLYYANAMQDGGGDQFALTLALRGFLSPWLHPLCTSMTGVGLGLARESESPSVRIAAPFLGFGAAIFLHAFWNGTATVSGAAFLCMVPLWLLFVSAFVVMVLVLVRRRGALIRAHLIDEVALGNIRDVELDLVCSMFGGLTAFLRRGPKGAEFVRAIARLGLLKWHAARAMRGRNHTVSFEFIGPMRAKIHALRQEGASPV